MALSIKTKTDIEAITRGLTLLGTGGGGRPELGVKRLEDALQKKGAVNMVSPQEIGDDEMTCCVFGMSSIAPNEDQPGAYGQYDRVVACHSFALK